MACAPIDVANAIKVALDAGVAASAFTLPFDCRAGIVFEERLPDMPGSGDRVIRPLVDVCIQPTPKLDLMGRPRYSNMVPTRIGMRQVLSSACYRDDGTIDLEKIRPQLTTFYELMKFLMPNTTHREGYTLTGVDAIWSPPMTILFAYEPDLLQTDKQYCGIFEVNYIVREAAT